MSFLRRFRALVSPGWCLAACVPGLLALVLFFSLAVHMRVSLGQWPTSIGERGFSAALALHATVATVYCRAALVAGLIVVPLGILICGCIPRWRWFAAVLLLASVGFALCLALMQLAPEPFLIWWREVGGETYAVPD